MGKTKDSAKKMIANELAPAIAVHPGEIIRDELEFRGISQRELSRTISVSPTIINEVLQGKRQLNTELALLISAALGVDAEPLIELQTKYNIYQAKRNEAFQARLVTIMNARRATIRPNIF